MGKVNQKHIGAGGRWLIFAGIPAAIAAVFFVSTVRSLDQVVGEKISPFFLFFVPVVIVIGAMVLYDHFPKRLVLPLGIAGWIMHFLLLYWFFWFGPGAFGHH